MFADPLDHASHQEAQIRQMRIEAIQARGRELEPNGFCHFCDDPVSSVHLFCDAECSADYERSKR